ncbi:MAG TPA: NADPH-dependent FMN reductase [Chitinophaga sp.]|uniref:NADPH-dependent FMN reductase n=1 Tax=Chitinophaga sp. TaxID=1869181 RepID=UPI002B9841E7|nr:NADPH-dependent FMN reductase [Chitinophaga sp.]HVI44639.1 NADPH-dependent FMN reductase [Chitinophaga sp.]
MPDNLNILAICGSTRTFSSNLNLLKAIAVLAGDFFDLHFYDGLTALPPFNPDLDENQPPAEVARFREQVKAADAVIICTPEYAGGVPGALKNAIDWGVSAMTFSPKPVALITASTAGSMGHQSLLGTLLIIESSITAETQLLIPAVRTKVGSDAKITDPATLDQVIQLIVVLKEMVGDGKKEVRELQYLTHPPVH